MFDRIMIKKLRGPINERENCETKLIRIQRMYYIVTFMGLINYLM
jgi:hypothetical protein